MTAEKRSKGENGHAQLTVIGLEDDLLALFDASVRGVERKTLDSLTTTIIQKASAARRTEDIKQLFLLAFQTRWCRGGKGERLIFMQLLCTLYRSFPRAVVGLIHLVPQYGYWKDLLLIASSIGKDDVDFSPLCAEIWRVFAEQIRADGAELEAAEQEGRRPALSLAAKFAPSEGGHFSKTSGADREIRGILFPKSGLGAVKQYRQLLSRLRRALCVPEVLMCANRWAEIKFKHVPSRCLGLQKMAFLNEKESGPRPNTPDRVQCRANLLAEIDDKGVAAIHGKQMFPHELVQEVLSSKGGFCVINGVRVRHSALSEGVRAVINAQWEGVRQNVLDHVDARMAELKASADTIDRVGLLRQASTLCPHTTAISVAADVLAHAAISTGASKAVGLSRLVAMSDVSGSMSGVPMAVSIALGILVSEITHPAFRDKVLTFHETPTWHHLGDCPSFVDKVLNIERAEWGGSTNFHLAMKAIEDVVREHKMPASDIPDLLVISDMQFDESLEYGQTWSTSREIIRANFARLGVELHGVEMQPPNVIFWNVRSNTVGFPAQSDDEGVMLLSGFSPALMKFILSGELETEEVAVNDQGKFVTQRVKATPHETLQRILSDPGLDSVRAVLDKHAFFSDSA